MPIQGHAARPWSVFHKCKLRVKSNSPWLGRRCVIGDFRLLDCNSLFAVQNLVQRCYIDGPEGSTHFCTGTGVGLVLNAGVVPTDCQTWTFLSHITPEIKDACLKYVVASHQTTSGGFLGMRFSSTGREIQNENTAGAALALGEAGWPEGEALLGSLQEQVTSRFS